jgi:hypothetical protein
MTDSPHRTPNEDRVAFSRKFGYGTGILRYALKIQVCSVLLVGSLFAEPYDLQEYIDGQLAAGVLDITIPTGRYEVTPKDGFHLLFKNLKNVTINASGVEMVCTETTQAIGIQNCKNLTIRGLTVDYDPLPFTQGVIESISEDRKSHTIRIVEGFPRADQAAANKHGVYRSDGNLRFGNYYSFSVRSLAADLLEISGLNPNKDGGEQLGDVVVVGAKYITGKFRPHAILTEYSENTVLQDITLYASPSFGFFEEHCKSTTYLRCVVDRREGRMRSLNADAFHSKFATVGPRIEDSKAMWQGDDCLNICGSYHLVTGSDGDYIRVISKRGLDIQAGDLLEVVHLDGHRMADVTAISVEHLGQKSDEDMGKIQTSPFNTKIKEVLNDVHLIKVEPALDLPYGSVVGASNRKGNGFSVVGCTFGNNRSRGI